MCDRVLSEGHQKVVRGELWDRFLFHDDDFT